VYATLAKMADEDPTVRLKVDPETGQTILSGMGELHIDVLVERLRREYKVAVKLGRPEVAYRETISRGAEGEGKFIKQTGGKGHYGHVVLQVRPLARGQRYQFSVEFKGDKIPVEFLPAVEEGVREAMETGGLAGYPVIDVAVVVKDGSSHPVDSNEIAYKIAGSLAFKNACKQAGLLLLEPIMKIEITTPEEFLGEVLGDMNARKGKIGNIETRGSTKIVRGVLPLRNTFGYATSIRSLTQGRASYIIEPLHYEPVPEEEVPKIMHL
jgi:elongation factor G